MDYNPLHYLEWLTRYGFIDIAFGIGILGYIKRALSSPVVQHIEGIDIQRKFRTDGGGYFEIKVLNLTSQPLYIYKAYFEPWRSFWVSAVTRTDAKRPKFPKVAATENMNLQGEYLLTPYDEPGNRVQSVFLESRGCAFYCLHIENGANVIPIEQNNLDELIRLRRCGTLKLHCVHGTAEHILRTPI